MFGFTWRKNLIASIHFVTSYPLSRHAFYIIETNFILKHEQTNALYYILDSAWISQKKIGRCEGTQKFWPITIEVTSGTSASTLRVSGDFSLTDVTRCDRERWQLQVLLSVITRVLFVARTCFPFWQCQTLLLDPTQLDCTSFEIRGCICI